MRRKKIKYLITVILLALTFTQCASTSQIMQSWVGHHKSELYQSWGPPTRITGDGQGGEILIYETYINTGQTSGEVRANPNGSISYTTPQQNGYTRTRMFYVDKYGKIYNWRWQGL